MPTRRGLLLVPVGTVLAVAGAAYGVEEFVLLALAVAAVLAASTAWVAASGGVVRRALHVEVSGPNHELVVGEPASLTVVLANTGRRWSPELWLERGGPWDVSYPGLGGFGSSGGAGERRGAPSVSGRIGQVRTYRARSAFAAGDVLPVPSLAPGEHFAAALPVPTDRRGLWTLAPCHVWFADPFGLAGRRVARSPGLHVVVCPAPPAGVDVEREPAGHGGQGATVEAHGQTRHARAVGDELAGLRQYIAGDRLNRLHWPALARTGDLVVREFVEPDAPCVEVFVDDRPSVVEASVRRAVRLGITALEAGTAVDLRTGAGERLTVPPGPSSRLVLLQALAVVAPATPGRR